MPNYKLTNINQFIPKKLKTRINKTSVARDGTYIHKRRNVRNNRVIIQYSIWKDLIKNNSGRKILEHYKEGYVVTIDPEDYFGNNHPDPSPNLEEEFILGETGFVYYKKRSQYDKYKPLPQWNHVYELNQKEKIFDKDWVGDCVINVRNSNDIENSKICDRKRSDEETEALKKQIKIKFQLEEEIDKIPKQSGIGNFDFDYADEETIENTKFQILYLILMSKSYDGKSYPEYIYDNYVDIKDNKEAKNLENNIKLNREIFIKKFNEEFELFKTECKRRNLLDFKILKELGIWNEDCSTPICPLCYKQIYLEEFFDDMPQIEGRQVADNTQQSIELMHLEPLASKKFNHNIYNLGWGHHNCNLIQGNKSISETIKDLERIVISFHKSRKDI